MAVSSQFRIQQFKVDEVIDHFLARVLHVFRLRLWYNFDICWFRSGIYWGHRSLLAPISGQYLIYRVPNHYSLNFLEDSQLFVSNPIGCWKRLVGHCCWGNCSVFKCNSSNLILVKQLRSTHCPIQPKQYILIRVYFMNLRFVSNSSL